MVGTDVAEDTRRPGRLAELYERHAPAATRLAYLLSGDHDQAEDLVHDAFVRVAGRLRHLRFPDAFDSYLRHTIVNLHTSRLRRLRREREYMERERHTRPEESFPPDVGLREELWRALQTLPGRQRAAVVLRYYEDLSERQTAEVLGCSIAAVKSAVARAMRALREGIRGEDA